MPRFVPVPNVIKVRFFWSIGGYGGMNLLHWQYVGGPPDPATCATLAQDFYEAFAAHPLTVLSATNTLKECRVTDLSSDTGAEGQYILDTNGGDAAGAGSCQLAVNVKLPVALRYRGGHPKIYLPPFPDNKKANTSEWSSAAANSLEITYTLFQLAMSGVTVGDTTTDVQVAVKYIDGGVPLDFPLVLTVGSGIVQLKQSSQRRRRLQPISV